MEELKITIPDAVVTRVIDGMCKQCGYQENILNPATGVDEPNPETKIQFAKRMLIEFVKNNVKAAEASTAQDTARQAALASVDKNITLT